MSLRWFIHPLPDNFQAYPFFKYFFPIPNINILSVSSKSHPKLILSVKYNAVFENTQSLTIKWKLYFPQKQYLKIITNLSWVNSFWAQQDNVRRILIIKFTRKRMYFSLNLVVREDDNALFLTTIFFWSNNWSKCTILFHRAHLHHKKYPF